MGRGGGGGAGEWQKKNTSFELNSKVILKLTLSHE